MARQLQRLVGLHARSSVRESRDGNAHEARRQGRDQQPRAPHEQGDSEEKTRDGGAGNERKLGASAARKTGPQERDGERNESDAECPLADGGYA